MIRYYYGLGELKPKNMNCNIRQLKRGKDVDVIKSGRVGKKVNLFAKTPAQGKNAVTVVAASHMNGVQHIVRHVGSMEK